MKKTVNSVLLLAALLSFCLSESKAQTFDLMTDPQGWSKGIGSFILQCQPIKKFSFYGGISFTSSLTEDNDFQRRFNTVSFSTEIRYFPFGVRNIKLSKQLQPWQRLAKFRNPPCPGFRKKRNDILQGIYIAPGYRYEKTHLDYVPNPVLESPINKFSYLVTSHAVTLHLGYQIRLANVTLDAGYGISLSHPTWQGPLDIFGDSLYTNIYPWKFRLDKGFRFGVGVNF